MRPSRDDILERFKACTQKLGKTPGIAQFCRLTGVKAWDVGYYWPNQTALAREAGVPANTMQQRIPDRDVFEAFARICLYVGKIPTKGELLIAGRELGERTAAILKRGPLPAFRKTFREWLKSAPEKHTGIGDLPGWELAEPRQRETQRVSPVLIFHPFLPASLQFLDVLARGERPSGEILTESLNTIFERRCADAFRCLGFEVESLGQGRGRAADCLAISRRHRFGVIVDAKLRENGYALGTEDRKFLEYAKTHAKGLNSEGIERCYFAVIGSAFREKDLKQLETYLAGTAIRSIVFFTAKALMGIVEDSIRERSRFDLQQIEQVLFGNKIIAA
jgi:hypothetical protein